MPKKQKKIWGKDARPAGGYRERKQSVVDRLDEAGRTHGKSAKQIKQEKELDTVFEPEEQTEPESKDWFDVIFGD